MESQVFDDLLRSLSTAPTRRRLSQMLTGLALAGPLGFFKTQADADAKKHKKHKKRKKKCKSGTKKCGKACIPVADCCTDDDCGTGESCCDGQCIPPVYCGTEKTCGCDQVCKATANLYTCQAGRCPVTEYCIDSETYYCTDDPICACATSVDDVNGCIDQTGYSCVACDSDADCTEALGKPALCLTGGQWCCAGGTTCAPLCTDSADRAVGRSHRAPVSKAAR